MLEIRVLRFRVANRMVHHKEWVHGKLTVLEVPPILQAILSLSPFLTVLLEAETSSFNQVPRRGGSGPT